MKEDVNDNLNDINVFLNKKKRIKIVTRKKAQLVSHENAQITGVEFDKVFAAMAFLEAIRMLLDLFFYLMFPFYDMDVKSTSHNRYLNEDVNQDVPYNLYDMLVTEFPTQRKDKKVAKLDEQEVILNFVPLQMILLVDVLKTIAKNADCKMNKTIEKVSPSDK